MSGLIDLTRDGPLATVTLNRPERLNALTLPMWQGLAEHFETLAGDDSVRCVILTGAGKAFAAGADIDEFDTVRATPEQAKDYDLVMRRALAAVRDCPHPVVARIRGTCVGGGLELAAMADLRYANEGARFGVPINRIGVVMAHPELAGLLAHCGPAQVLELLLEARIVGAAEAQQMGLLNQVFADEALDEEVATRVHRITEGAPLVNRWHKQFVRRLTAAAQVPPEELGEAYRFLETNDYAEGLAAFRDKRRPDFTAS
ncbi:enoyl-CoA hydratase/isomerase family protein [Roseospirillum parvum]|uniref:Enoyl-CoA hydratase/carnithine racemase n=1 Tax=Roseospirillum parvum TaxID=83401 RepID=A0A1G8CI44_9PROT|nr:enoyl-CoA hydratase-related protein [Roseospirillum parvum]SDH45039.1 Enoyl-CoA hydratase/carnithine racemase [Roseospirillum parvum]